MPRPKKKAVRLVISSLFAGGCLSAFAIFGWGVELGTVAKSLIVWTLIFFSISIPAALFLIICKGVAYLFRDKSEQDQ